jgi:hypothetical protein
MARTREEAQVRQEEVFVVLVSVVLLAGVLVMWMAMMSRSRLRELEHRERLAMIERGLAPPPERDPAAFEGRLLPRRASQTAVRTRSAGVMLIGVGFALMLLITFTGGGEQIGIGIGGAFAVLGAAFVVNAALSARDQPPDLSYPAPTRPADPPDRSPHVAP